MEKQKFSNEDFDDQDINLSDEELGDEGIDDTPLHGDDNMSEDELPEDDNSAKVAGAADGQEWKDKYLRLSAEFDNFRKRTLREKMDLISSGGEDVLKSMLPLMDDMDRAVKAAEEARDMVGMKEGVELIAHKLRETLHSKGVTEIQSVGQPLDTDLHEAVALLPVEEGHKGKIIDVVQKGYIMKDKVIRHAKVVVGE